MCSYVALLSLLCIAITSCNKAQQDASAPKLRGDLIATPAVENSTDNAVKRKHPKPPSVQRRMVLAELTLQAQSNSAAAALPSGTAGTSADLAKTNLPSITSLTVPDLKIPGYHNITFNTLSDFDFALTQDIANETAALAMSHIPDAVRSLDARKVVIEGFLLPVKMNNGLAVEFLLMRNQSMCCYGVPPKINEWITVQINGKGVKPVMDQPIAVAGVSTPARSGSSSRARHIAASPNIIDVAA